MPGQTPSQTVGPFFAFALTPEAQGFRPVAGSDLADAETPGTRIEVLGRVLDGRSAPVADALIEVWQPDHLGTFPDGTGRFLGFGRSGTDAQGRFGFRTIKPGPAAGTGAPFLSLAVFARGMLNHAFTRMYFSDEGPRTAGIRSSPLCRLPGGIRSWPVAACARGLRPTTS